MRLRQVLKEMPFLPERRRGPEFLDLPPEAYTPEELEGTLSDIRAVNRYLGDVPAIIKHVSLMSPANHGEVLTILDIATGSADIPVAIADWARKNGFGISVTCIDINPLTVGIARKNTEAYPEIEVLVADGFDLRFPDKSFDLVLCSKTLHHFTEEEVARLVRGVMRVARHGYILMDLRRSRMACVLIYILTRLFTRNRLTRNDGPLSVLRSYTPSELASLASAAGASHFTVWKEPFWLMVLTGRVA